MTGDPPFYHFKRPTMSLTVIALPHPDKYINHSFVDRDFKLKIYYSAKQGRCAAWLSNITVPSREGVLPGCQILQCQAGKVCCLAVKYIIRRGRFSMS